jgi:PAS domain S-box-containing protein
MIKKPAAPELTILVVDDNLVHRRMSQTILTAAGYGVRLAEGGLQALASFEKNRPDIALVDIHMPGMDGFEVCRRLRAMPDGQKVPILFLTDVSDLASPDQALAAGGDDFLNKPINRIELLMRVRSLLRERHHEAVLSRVLEEVRDAVAIVDAKGIIIRWSHQAMAVLGFSAGEAIGQSLSRLILTQPYQQEFEDRLARYLSSDDRPVFNQNTSSHAVQKGGRQLPAEFSVTAVRTANETSFCVFIREVASANPPSD